MKGNELVGLHDEIQVFYGFMAFNLFYSLSFMLFLGNNQLPSCKPFVFRYNNKIIFFFQAEQRSLHVVYEGTCPLAGFLSLYNQCRVIVSRVPELQDYN